MTTETLTPDTYHVLDRIPREWFDEEATTAAIAETLGFNAPQNAPPDRVPPLRQADRTPDAADDRAVPRTPTRMRHRPSAVRMPSKRERWKLATLGKTPERLWASTMDRRLDIHTPLAIEDLRCPLHVGEVGTLAYRRSPRGPVGFTFEYVCNKCGTTGLAHCGVQTL